METQDKHFNGYEWYRLQMEQRTRAALQKQDEEFITRHLDDTDEELLQYLKRKAKTLGHAPRMEEVPGGILIAKRFGGWRGALRRAGFSAPAGPGKPERTQRYRKEYTRQQALYRREKQYKQEKQESKRTEQ